MSKDNKTGTNTNTLLGCLFFVAIDCASPLYTSVDAHGVGASTVPYNSLAVVNLIMPLENESNAAIKSKLHVNMNQCHCLRNATVLLCFPIR